MKVCKSLKDIITANYLEDYKGFYREAVERIGLDNCIKYLPKGGVERFRKALETDQHLNNIPMVEWDANYNLVTPNTEVGMQKLAAVRAEIEKYCKKKSAEIGYEIECYVFYKREQERLNFKNEFIKLGVGSLSPSDMVSTLKMAARMWVEREEE